MADKQPNRWFKNAEAPKEKPDLLDPAVDPKTAYPDSAITGASPEFGGDAVDLNGK